MAPEYKTTGQSRFNSFLDGLKAGGIEVRQVESNETYPLGRDGDGSTLRQGLRIGYFTNAEGQHMLVEEFLAVDDGTDGGNSKIAYAYYPEGMRPYLYRIVLGGGRQDYPDLPEDALKPLFCINTRLFVPTEGAAVT